MEKFDQISQYMYHMRVPQLTIKRVKQWYAYGKAWSNIQRFWYNSPFLSFFRCSYTWETQKSFDELAILEHLPGKMRTDVALDVHYDTIKNVKLFHGCDPGLLRELVVKLQPIIFLSGI